MRLTNTGVGMHQGFLPGVPDMPRLHPHAGKDGQDCRGQRSARNSRADRRLIKTGRQGEVPPQPPKSRGDARGFREGISDGRCKASPYAAFRRMSGIREIKLVLAPRDADVEKTPLFLESSRGSPIERELGNMPSVSQIKRQPTTQGPWPDGSWTGSLFRHRLHRMPVPGSFRRLLEGPVGSRNSSVFSNCRA